MNAITDIIPANAVAHGAISVTVPDLRRAVAQTAAVTERRNTIPVLGCLRIVPAGDKLLITGTDLDMWLTVECPATCGPDTSAMLLPARLLAQILRGAEADDGITISKAADIVTLQVGQCTARIRETSSVDDFPEMAPSDNAGPFTVPAATLGAILTNCAPCISTEETRYYLNGVYLHERAGQLAGVATDGHRLSIYQTDAAWPVAGHIMHRKAVAILARMLPSATDADVGITAGPNRLLLQADGWTAAVKTIDGTFPDYTRVIPPAVSDPGYAVLSPATLRRFPEPADGSRAAKLDLERSTMTYSDVYNGLEFTSPIEAGGTFAVGFNIKYLRGFTAAFGTIRLSAISSRDAARVTSQDPNWLGVIMPMRV